MRKYICESEMQRAEIRAGMREGTMTFWRLDRFNRRWFKIDAGKVSVTSALPGRDASRMQGLVRALIATMVKGTAEGYTKTLELRGTGYRAEMKGTTLNMSLGFSHPVIFPLPSGIKCEIPSDSKGTIVNLTGADKELMGQTAAKIRSFRPPEPYGGKGVRYQGEKVREKTGKAGKGAKGAK